MSYVEITKWFFFSRFINSRKKNCRWPTNGNELSAPELDIEPLIDRLFGTLDTKHNNQAHKNTSRECATGVSIAKFIFFFKSRFDFLEYLTDLFSSEKASLFYFQPMTATKYFRHAPAALSHTLCFSFCYPCDCENLNEGCFYRWHWISIRRSGDECNLSFFHQKNCIVIGSVAAILRNVHENKFARKHRKNVE